jgi:hypothetical protein
MGRLPPAALWLAAAACGRFGFDFVEGSGSNTMSPDATGVPDDTGIPAVACPPIAMQAGTMVSTITQLRTAIANASQNETILLADGVYNTSTTIEVNAPDVTIRSASNHADAVIIDGQGQANPIFYFRQLHTSLIAVTLRNTGQDAIVVEPFDATTVLRNANIYDVTFTDIRGPAVRAKSYQSLATTEYADYGKLQCSRIGHTLPNDCGSDGVFGVRLMGVRGWEIRNNYFAGRCAAARVRAIWADKGARDIVISDNVFSDNGNNILMGGAALRTYPDTLPAGCTGPPDAWGGLVCNNRIAGLGVPARANEDFEEGIALWTACDTYVLHNTVVSPAGTETLENIEYRFTGTYAHLLNNLLEADPVARDGGTIDIASTNVRYASTADFVNAAAGDLRLTHALALGAPINDCLTDAAGKPRNAGAPTPGAYEP